MLRGQSEFDAAGAAADDGQAQPRQLPGAGQQGFPALREIGDRLDRDRVFDGARDIVRARRRADVERNEIVADRRVGTAQHLALAAVEADRLVADQPGAGKAREASEIDVALVKAIMAGDPAGQHPRIGGFDVAGDEGQAHPRHRAHGKALQHTDMGVPAADKDQVVGDCNLMPHRPTMPQPGSEDERDGPLFCAPAARRVQPMREAYQPDGIAGLRFAAAHDRLGRNRPAAGPELTGVPSCCAAATRSAKTNPLAR